MSALVSPELIATLPLWLVVFLFSTICHEAAHAWIARIGGDNTAYAAGQVSLDPIPHVRRHPIGMLLVPVMSFIINGGGWMIGWASAPYNASWADRYPRRAAWMAAAGPAANLLLVVLAAIAIRAGIAAEVFQSPQFPATDRIVELVGGDTNVFSMALSVLFSLNLLLFSFNLMPFPPLDGSAILGLVLPVDWFRKWQELFREPMFSLVGLVVAWQLFGEIWVRVYFLALSVLYPDVRYISS